MSKKVILITGSNGEIGSSLINKLSQNNYIISLDLAHKNNKKSNIKNIRGSILDKNLLKASRFSPFGKYTVRNFIKRGLNSTLRDK